MCGGKKKVPWRPQYVRIFRGKWSDCHRKKNGQGKGKGSKNLEKTEWGKKTGKEKEKERFPILQEAN